MLHRLMPKTPAADFVVRRPDSTSVKRGHFRLLFRRIFFRVGGLLRAAACQTSLQKPTRRQPPPGYDTNNSFDFPISVTIS